MYHKNGDVTVVTHVSQCHHHDQGLVIPSVTHYTHEVQHDQGTPGIFFKFEPDPLHITLHQWITSFLQLLIQVVVSVFGGIFICMGYTIHITTCTIEVISSADQTFWIVAAVFQCESGLESKMGWERLSFSDLDELHKINTGTCTCCMQQWPSLTSASGKRSPGYIL